MTNEDLNLLVEGWIAYWTTPEGSEEREALAWVIDREYDLMQKQPDRIWVLILAILKKNSSDIIKEVLSAGPPPIQAWRRDD